MDLYKLFWSLPFSCDHCLICFHKYQQAFEVYIFVTERIALKNVRCIGFETDIEDCQGFGSWRRNGNGNCNNVKIAAGVVCDPASRGRTTTDCPWCSFLTSRATQPITQATRPPTNGKCKKEVSCNGSNFYQCCIIKRGWFYFFVL